MASLFARVRFALGLASLLALLLGPGLAHAQSNGDGSIYSRFGLGSLQTFSSPQSQAMGGGGYALRSLNYNPTANPALWSDQIYTRLSLGGSYETVSATSDQGGTNQLVAGTVEALQFSFPLYDRKLGVGLSFQPFTQHNYRARRSGTLSESSYNVNARGGGGLHSFRGGLGYRINEVLRVGASVDVIFGILERRQSTTFDQTDNLQDARVSDETRLAGVGGTLGAHLALADVLLSDDALSVGAAVSLPTTLNGKRVLTVSEFQRVAYRLGAYTERLYVQPDATTNLQTYAVTGGLSLPTALSGTRIDLNLRAGTRGTTQDALVRDRFYGVSLHINFGEEWFQRRKLR